MRRRDADPHLTRGRGRLDASRCVCVCVCVCVWVCECLPVDNGIFVGERLQDGERAASTATGNTCGHRLLRSGRLTHISRRGGEQLFHHRARWFAPCFHGVFPWNGAQPERRRVPPNENLSRKFFFRGDHTKVLRRPFVLVRRPTRLSAGGRLNSVAYFVSYSV